MRNLSKTLLTILITSVLTLVFSMVAVYLFFLKVDFPFEKLIKIGSIIDSSYVGEYDIEECEENAINAVLGSINDKYAVYYDEENAKETMQLLDGYYVGIGTEIFANIDKNRIEVVSAYQDSPADKAGIVSGDLIVAIDGKEYTADSIADAVLYMKGVNIDDALNKTICITIMRNGDTFDVQLKRAKIDMYKVTSEIIDNICYIRYSGFTQGSYDALKKVVDSLDGKNVSGIVIDVRNNPGGEFGSAIDLCDLFLDNGMIMYTVDKDGDKNVYNATKGKCELPLAIIVNGSSASASEILAGSLQARGRAVIVGEKTYGKGVSQTLRYINPLDESEGAIKLTTCKNYTPDGKWINESIIPDIEASVQKLQGNIREDAAFIAAAEYLKTKYE
ncbi:MAG: S41 family peptidase [Ruminococcaceae bacterium]|nr:S41 family peptidase [Oscillospiraceae bacterium]